MDCVFSVIVIFMEISVTAQHLSSESSTRADLLCSLIFRSLFLHARLGVDGKGSVTPALTVDGETTLIKTILNIKQMNV